MYRSGCVVQVQVSSQRRKHHVRTFRTTDELVSGGVKL